MKIKLAFFTFCMITSFLLPMLAVNFDLSFPVRASAAPSVPPPISAPNVPESSPAPPSAAFSEPIPEKPEDSAVSVFSFSTPGFFRIYNESGGKVERVSMRDYVRGSIASEMPPDFHSEALKAQGVASLTYALRQQLENQDADCDFSADPSKRLGYVTEEMAREMYGDSFDIHWSKIVAAADEASRYVMVWNDEPILAAYHAISSGITESAENIWGGKIEYLVPVESAGDLLAPEYQTEVVFDDEQVKRVLKEAAPEISLEEEPSKWFSKPKTTASGYVTEIEAGDVFFTGVQIRELFDLRSGAFIVEHGKAGFSFSVRGYGHGVGLSQRGADYMARQGADFREILEHYYPGAKLQELKTES